MRVSGAGQAVDADYPIRFMENVTRHGLMPDVFLESGDGTFPRKPYPTTLPGPASDSQSGVATHVAGIERVQVQGPGSHSGAIPPTDLRQDHLEP